MQNTECSAIILYLLSLSKRNLSKYLHSKLVSWFLIEGTLGSMTCLNSRKMMHADKAVFLKLQVEMITSNRT